ncbi:SDR family NAD(P)-dependent oxidoreductase [Paenibacillus sp. NPDC057934]|uniref:SDR family NAD(P)-dependent oxidoreductase n=1 Tax=Paenibacillus sp. NPDC057934 TaxID=3346282 RepID=UPI0036DEC2F3
MRKPKTFMQKLHNDNFIVRDHRVHGVRTLPGIALLEMIYRLSDIHIGTMKIELRQILFKQPVVTSEAFDRHIFVTFSPLPNHWRITITSKKVKNGIELETQPTENMECLLDVIDEQAQKPQPMDLPMFIQNSEEQWDMDEMYEVVRKSGVQHDDFMKTLGRVYQRGNDEVMQLQLSELAYRYFDAFYAHVAFLDGASMAGMSFSINGTQNWINEDRSTYLPISIGRFCINRKLTRTVFTHTIERAPTSVLPINPDIVSRDITVYDESGEVLVEFEKFSVKRIRESNVIQSLEENRSTSSFQHPLLITGQEPVLESSFRLEQKQRITAYLIGIIAKVNTETNIVSTSEGFYELGLDSIQLLGLVRVLEEKLNTSLYPTLLFEYSTIDRLAVYLLENHENAFSAIGDMPTEESDVKGKAQPALPLSPQDSSVAKKHTQAYLIGVIAEALQIHPDHICTSDGFYELGLDSVKLLGLVKVLEARIKGTLYPTLLFEYTTIDSLSDYLLEHYESAFSHCEEATVNGTKSPESSIQEDLGETIYLDRKWVKREIQRRESSVRRHHVVILYDYPTELMVDEQYFDEFYRLHSGQPDETLQFEDKLKQVMLYIQSIMKRKANEQILLQIVSVDGSPYVFALEGLLKTLYLENPKFHSQIIKLEPSLEQSSNKLMAEWLKREANAHEEGNIALWHRMDTGECLIQEYNEVHPKISDPLYKRDGVYVITGGLGGLGIQVANHLASRERVKIALIGRSKPDQHKSQMIREWIKMGSEVLFFESDISKESDVKNTIDSIRMQWGTITGIFHCAGVIKDKIILQKHAYEISEVFAPKVRGFRHLDQATQEDNLDWFVVFSSVSAITGNLGQADYSSVNGCLDLVAAERQTKVDVGERSGRTITLNWPLWQEGGMQIDENIQQMFYRSRGNRALPTKVGLQAMDNILAHSLTQAIILYGDGDKIRRDFLQSGSSDDRRNTLLEETISSGTDEDIVIIGLSGKYPMANNIDEFYNNLEKGKDCISSIPKERWENNYLNYDVEQYYKYGGFLDRIDEFDPMFFNISAAQAERMDPQARQFLQVAWEACEDAGFLINRNKHEFPSSSDRSVGVFAGVFWNTYELFSAEMTQRGNPLAFGVSAASIANMVSYTFNFHGPSISIDSMCSSSLTAIHMASESIKRGECQYAIAGGVNLVTHPHKYLFLHQAQFLSSDGRCRSFGSGGDGYVPGEGVGAILLAKRSQAEEGGYPIYGVIKGSAINHAGKTSGATVPDPVAQSEVIADAIARSGINPRTISYVEAHGTGTSLGDPIEVHGLERAFGKWFPEKQYCAIGSVKSNIGHTEAAAGIAGVTKVLMQMKHKTFFPSLHAKELNPYISFEDTPFFVQRDRAEWARPEIEISGEKKVYPRRAGISSFGANGSNAHLIIEEYIETSPESCRGVGSFYEYYLVPLSAKSKRALQIYAQKLLQYFEKWQMKNDAVLCPPEDIHQLLREAAFTLQTGREEMKCRVAFVSASLEELMHKLECYCNDEPRKDYWFEGDGSSHQQNNKSVAPTNSVQNMDNIGDWNAMADWWTAGNSVDWNLLYGSYRPNRIHLPTYPFAKERYWVPKEEARSSEENRKMLASPEADHPLLLHTAGMGTEGVMTLSNLSKPESKGENCWNIAWLREDG